MSSPTMEDALREAIIARPDVILDDRDVMQALIGANDRSMGENIVDLRGVAMDRLELRLDRLEDTHRSVIAAAYENLTGTNQVHRAILMLLDPLEFEPFLQILGNEIAEVLRVNRIRLVLESTERDPDPVLTRLGSVMAVAAPGYVDAYVTMGRSIEPRRVTLRQVQHGSDMIYGDLADWIRSEVCLRLDLGTGRLPGMLVMGSEDPDMFTPQHGAELLGFFADVFERCMRRWLA